MTDDILDRLRRSEEKYRLLFEHAPLGYQSLDPEGRLLEVNRTWQDLLGYGRDEVLGRAITDFLTPESRALFEERFPEFKRTGEIRGLDFTLLRADGDPLEVLYDGRIAYGDDGEMVRSHCMFRDVTETRRARRAQLDSESRLHALADASFESIFLSDKGICLDQNATAERMFGYTRAEAVGRPGTDWIAPADRDTVLRHMREGREAPYEVVAMRKDGSTFTAEIQGRMFEFEGRPIRVTALRDVSDRKRIEREAVAGRLRFNTLFEHAADFMLLLDPSDPAGLVIVDANRSVCIAHGLPRESMIGRPLASLLTEETDARTETRARRILDGETLTFEATHRLPNSATLTVEVTATLFEEGGQSLILSIARDLSRRRALEREMMQTEKLESLGVLAGGIAHDFNNLLGGILGNIAMARQDLPDDDERAEILADAQKAAQRAASLTKRLLTFSKGGAPIMARTSVAQVVRDSADFALSGGRIRCAFAFDDELHPVRVDKELISQVIQNLAINAKQAMPEGGEVAVSGRNVHVEPDSLLPVPPGDYLCIAVADTGPGIPPDVLGNIFDPFFTTKSEGSGLGLSTSYSIVQQHEGFIHVESELGRGTTFTIYLPAATGRAPDAPAPAAARTAPDAPPAGARLLVMDDEQLVLDLVERMLRQFGYEADCVLDAKGAVDRYRASLDPETPDYDAVILDLTVRGGHGGLDVIEVLREMDPGVKALVCSGYSDDPVMADCRRFGFDAALVKPFEPEVLRDALHDLLDGPPAG